MMRIEIPIVQWSVPGVGPVKQSYLQDGEMYAVKSDGMADIVWRENHGGWDRVGIIGFEAKELPCCA
jgi:hypothetical protein